MSYQWAVIGAGPAGIAAVGKLLDFAVPAKEILWVDPQFTVGDFGTRWRNVPSNTKVNLFLKFLQASPAFNYHHLPDHFEIHRTNPHQTCHLRVMAEALQWVTDHLKKTIPIAQDSAQSLSLSQRKWHIQFKTRTAEAKNVILAIGAEPKNLTYPTIPTIPLQDAMDSERLHQHLQPDDTVAVFGSSHSAILVLRNLVEQKAKRIINFYRSPLRYAVYLDKWILFDDTGLKGPTADWAKENIDGNLPQQLQRVFSNEENIEHYLPQCNKACYAVGFERRPLPIIQNVGHMSYIEQAGIIAPGLFGLGIAFPEAKTNPLGLVEYRVGLWKFIEYLHKILPIWLKYEA